MTDWQFSDNKTGAQIASYLFKKTRAASSPFRRLQASLIFADHPSQYDYKTTPDLETKITMQQYSCLSLHAAAWFFVGNANEGGEQKVVRIKTPFQIGRNPDADLCLHCASVSGFHAEILEEDGELWLGDLNSTNGTFVNGKRITTRCRLKPSDTIQFGTAVFRVNRDQDANGEVDAAEANSRGNSPASIRMGKSTNALRSCLLMESFLSFSRSFKSTERSCS